MPILLGMNDTQVFVTLAQLAKQLNLPKAWLHREAIAGRIPSIKAGPVRRFNVAAVAEAINATGRP